MKKILLIIATLCISACVYAEQISTIEHSGSWVYLYNSQGRKFKTLSQSSVGYVAGYSSHFFVSQKGNWIYLWDSDGRKYKTLSVSSVGEVIGVAGDTFVSKKGNWIYTWNSRGQKIATRPAR